MDSALTFCLHCAANSRKMACCFLGLLGKTFFTRCLARPSACGNMECGEFLQLCICGLLLYFSYVSPTVVNSSRSSQLVSFCHPPLTSLYNASTPQILRRRSRYLPAGVFAIRKENQGLLISSLDQRGRFTGPTTQDAKTADRFSGAAIPVPIRPPN